MKLYHLSVAAHSVEEHSFVQIVHRTLVRTLEGTTIIVLFNIFFFVTEEEK